MDRIVVVDDALRDSAWEQELYCLGVPPSVDTVFASVNEARRDLPLWRADSHRFIVLVRDLDTLERLAAGGLLQSEEINLGGLHSAPGREHVLPYLFLSAHERDQLRSIAAAGGIVTARDLPGSRAIPLTDLLGKR